MPSHSVRGRAAARYVIKCDECKRTIGTTDSLRKSAAGGVCPECWQKAMPRSVAGPD